MKSSFEYLEDLLADNYPIIACESPLQERHRFLIRITTSCRQVGKKVYIWNLSEDSIKELVVSPENNLIFQYFHDYKPSVKQNTEDYFQVLNFWRVYSGAGVLIVENIFPWLKESITKDTEFLLLSEWIKSSLVNLKFHTNKSDKTTLLLGANAELASEIAAEIPLWSQELPDTQEIIASLISSNLFPLIYTEQDYLEIANASAGLYISDIIYCLNDIRKNHDLGNSSEIAKLLLAKKIQLLNRLYDIEFLPPPKVQLGGLELMQQSFKKFKRLLSPHAKQYNLRVPKGIMLVGPPGTGKSHSAKACSQNMGIPLIMVDWGNFRNFGNQAEMKLKRLLRLADRLNQVILYFDDFDKGFAGDDDLAKRLAGQLLTWMQERTSDVLVIASVNRMEWLPPELTRAGRFDYLFKVDLPNNGERYSIFKLHAARFDERSRNGGDPWSEEQWRRILKATNRCVGAEIQTIVERAASSIFCETITEDTYSESQLPALELTIEALLEERRQINPLAIREADRVESMRNKADQQALPSSPLDESKFAVGNIEIFS
ncbi:ATP-binding protein [Fischerella thermalis]|uniref:ATP-binding protein n=1 Tax=Fischerella thermalis TaxID=372787 RepID=UPI000C7FC7C9|nr:ATP-binding protein [Fischerella thermalis]PLZ05196.1 AAA family ATPase [Fischerella thermalis WC1110]PLZ38209.1 AAA family ATPase [Fischerella thermalis WC538]PLZ40480.1 AAA family ATPase [Fischerella thermalis WC527]PLZ50068.1 AAA family ATPase [Fischerella thermalis WC441]PLZ58584.1 AAA family ATPase [Fischerella thermalis WC344]